MPKLIIARPNEWANRRRSYDLLLDDQLVGTIKNDQIIELNISGGRHSLKGRFDWRSSDKFDFSIADDEIKYLKISTFKHGRWLMPTLSVIILLHIFVLQPVFRHLHADLLDNLFFAFVIICALFLVYLNTFGRKRYLWIRNDLK